MISIRNFCAHLELEPRELLHPSPAALVILHEVREGSVL